MSPKQSARAKAAGVKPSKPPKATAPTSTAKVERVLLRIESGELLRASCKAEKLTPKLLYDWVERDPKNSERYARARRRQADAMIEDTFAIADDSGFDGRIVDGRVEIDGEAIQRARLRVDTRKWYAAKIAPRMYGDKVDVTSDGKALQSFTLGIGVA